MHYLINVKDCDGIYYYTKACDSNKREDRKGDFIGTYVTCEKCKQTKQYKDMVRDNPQNFSKKLTRDISFENIDITQSCIDLQKEMMVKTKESIDNTKLKALKERLVELNIQIDLETEMLKLFPKIKAFTDEDFEHIYYNDGSEFGLRVISFKTEFENDINLMWY